MIIWRYGISEKDDGGCEDDNDTELACAIFRTMQTKMTMILWVGIGRGDLLRA